MFGNNNNLIKRYTTEHTDLVIDLVDEYDDREILSMPVHRIILMLQCPFFNKLLTNFRESHQNRVAVKVSNIFVARDLILSFYGETKRTDNIPDWQYGLEWIKCSDYFGVDIDKNQIVKLDIPAEGTDLMLDIMNIIGYDKQTVKWLEKNLPADYELNSIPPALAKQLINHSSAVSLLMFEKYRIQLLNIETDTYYSDCRPCSGDNTRCIINVNHKHDEIAMAIPSADNMGCQILCLEDNKIVDKKYFRMKPSVSCLCFSLDDLLIITGNRYGVVDIYDPAAGTRTLCNPDKSSIVSIYHLVTGKILTVGENGTLNIWDPAITAPKMMQVSETEPTNVVSAISPDNTLVIIAFSIKGNLDEGWIIIYDAKSETFCYHCVFEGRTSACCMSADNRLLCLGGSGCLVKIFEYDQQKSECRQIDEYRTFVGSFPEKKEVTQLYFFPGSDKLITHDDIDISYRVIKTRNIHDKTSSNVL